VADDDLGAAGSGRPRRNVGGRGDDRAVDHSSGPVTTRLWPLLVAVRDALCAGVAVSAAVHAAHGWNPTADRHLDHQLVRREAMERLRPWGAALEDGGSGPLLRQRLALGDVGPDNSGCR